MIKKIILGALAFIAVPAMTVYAATPTLIISGQGSGNVNISVSNGEINAPVMLYYNSATMGTIQGFQLGSTNASGTFSGVVNTDMRAINWNTPVYLQVGGYQSNSVVWPYAFSGTMNNSFNSTTSASGSVSFSQSSPVVSVGQNGTVILSGGSGNYYIASNSNTSGVSPTLSGNVLTLSGVAAGQANIVVCSTGGGCGTLTTTVQGAVSPTLSQSNLSFTQNGQGSVTLSGGTAPFSVQIPNGSGLSTTLIGNTLYVNGTATGTAIISICSANNSPGSNMCSPLTVNVQAASNTNTNASSTNQNGPFGNAAGQFNFTVPLLVGQALSFNLGENGAFYIQTPVSSPVLASINDGNRLMLNGSAMGSGTVTVCQTGGSCFPINFVVHSSAYVATNNPPFTGTGGGILLTVNMGRGMSGPEVADLQTRLKEEGYFSPAVTGYFGGATQASVKRYQRDKGLPVTGYVGVQTRAMLNQ